MQQKKEPGPERVGADADDDATNVVTRQIKRNPQHSVSFVGESVQCTTANTTTTGSDEEREGPQRHVAAYLAASAALRELPVSSPLGHQSYTTWRPGPPPLTSTTPQTQSAADCVVHRVPMQLDGRNVDVDTSSWSAYSRGSSRHADRRYSYSDILRRYAMDRSHSGSMVHTASTTGAAVNRTASDAAEYTSIDNTGNEGQDDDDDDEEEEEDEEAIAERVLRSLQSKDVLIAELTEDIARITDDREAAMRDLGTFRHAQADLKAALQQAEEDARSWRHKCLDYKRELEDARQRIVPESQQSEAQDNDKDDYDVLSPQRAAPEQALRLDQELKEKEETLALLREELRHAQDRWSLQSKELEARQQEAAESRHRAKHLEMQLDVLLHEKKEDAGALREHIDHLQRELRDKAKEVKSQEKTHRKELASLQGEIALLSAEFDARAGSSADQKHLAEELRRAKQRETDMVRENEAMQQRWMYELESQKRLVEDLQASSHRRQGELAQRATVAKEHEAETTRAKMDLMRSQVKLNGLTEVHSRAENEIARLRNDVQQLTQSLAEATLKLNDMEQRVLCDDQQICTLSDALESAKAEIKRRENDILQVRHEAASQLQAWVAAQDEQHTTVLTQVEGCARSSERLEQALVLSERRRMESEDAERRAREERDEARLQIHQAQASSRKDMLEHQELAESISAVHREKLQDAEEQLQLQLDTVETLKAAAASSQQRVEELLSHISLLEGRASDATHKQARAEELHRRAETQLVGSREELKQALGAHLATRQELRGVQDALHLAESQQQQTTEKLRASRDTVAALQKGLLDMRAAVRHILAAAPRRSATAVGYDEAAPLSDDGDDETADGVGKRPAGPLQLLRDTKALIMQQFPAKLHTLRQTLTAKNAAVLSLQKEKSKLEAALQQQQADGIQSARDRDARYEQLLKASLAKQKEQQQHEAAASAEKERLEWTHKRGMEAAARRTGCEDLAKEVMRFVAVIPRVVEASVQRAVARREEEIMASIKLEQLQHTMPANSSAVEDSVVTTLLDKELMKECDDIIKNTLGVSGGWEELARAVLDDAAAAADAASSSSCAKNEKAAMVVKAALWSEEELADMQSVLTAYLATRLHPSPDADADTELDIDDFHHGGSRKKSRRRLKSGMLTELLRACVVTAVDRVAVSYNKS